MVFDDKVYVGVGEDPEHGEGIGHLWVVDASMDGDVTGKAVVWHRGNTDFHRTISTVAIADGILYAADLSGHLHALDANTGELYWMHDVFAAIWGSPFVADGKVYLGDEDGDIVVMRAGKKKELLHEVKTSGPVYRRTVQTTLRASYTGHYRRGVLTRIWQRVLALTAVVWHNDNIGAPIKRSLIAYDH